jgi:hypothetical protein
VKHGGNLFDVDPGSERRGHERSSLEAEGRESKIMSGSRRAREEWVADECAAKVLLK